MADIKLTPEELMAQSTEMASLQQEYETIFTTVTKALNGINDSWSENLAHNFSGKIQSAQKTFASIANMLLNGSSAARLSSLTFSSGTGISGILENLLGKDGLTSGTVSELAKWIQQEELNGTQGSWISELMEMGADTETIQEAVEKIKDQDYMGALQLAYEKGLDWTADALSGGIEKGSWVDTVNQMTGGALGLDGLESSFYKNWIGGTLEKAGEAVSEQYSGDPDYGKITRSLGEMAWNFTAGAPLKTAGDQIYEIVSDIPVIGDWYADRGATDAESILSVGLGEMTYAITGNSEDAAYVRNYYSDHGGVSGGIVDGIADIASYGWEKGTAAVGNLWNSIFGS